MVEHPRVPLCRTHYNSVHEGSLAILINGPFATVLEAGVPATERAIVPDDQAEDSRYWTDERLAGLWDSADTTALAALAAQCRVAHEFWRRYSWKERWYDEAAQYISSKIGRFVHWRRVYERAHCFTVFKDRWEDYEFLGARLSITVAEDAEPDEALEIAKVARANEYTVADTVAMVRQRDRARAAEPPEMHECPDCGARHRVKKGDRR